MVREVHCEDALQWLQVRGRLEGCSLVASLPDYSEFPGRTLAWWKDWFREAAALVLASTPDDGLTLFFQTDLKHEGTWVDKSHLIQGAARDEALLFHQIVCRCPAGSPSHGRPGYSHLLAFSRGLRMPTDRATRDVLPQGGEKTWPRGMGLEACRGAVRLIQRLTCSRTLVMPFCGQGLLLAVAEEAGLDAIGIELSPKRARKARLTTCDTPSPGRRSASARLPDPA